MFTLRYALNSYIKQTCFICKVSILKLDIKTSVTSDWRSFIRSFCYCFNQFCAVISVIIEIFFSNKSNGIYPNCIISYVYLGGVKKMSTIDIYGKYAFLRVKFLTLSHNYINYKLNIYTHNLWDIETEASSNWPRNCPNIPESCMTWRHCHLRNKLE